MKKINSYILKGALIAIPAIFLSTLGIDAVDHRDNFSESIIARALGQKSIGPCPSDMDLVDAAWGSFCIDRFEASASKNCPHPTPKNLNESQANIDTPDCQVNSESDILPWTSISQDQAIYACRKAGKHLATNREWAEAALGTPDKESAWGPDDCQVSSNWTEQPGLTGSGANCYSFAGAYDMIGNVWEWIDGTVNDGIYEGKELPASGFVYGIEKENYLPAETSPTAPLEYHEDYFWIKNSGIRAIARGGYWENAAEAGQYSHYIVAPPTFSGRSTGFRCAKETAK